MHRHPVYILLAVLLTAVMLTSCTAAGVSSATGTPASSAVPPASSEPAPSSQSASSVRPASSQAAPVLHLTREEARLSHQNLVGSWARVDENGKIAPSIYTKNGPNPELVQKLEGMDALGFIKTRDAWYILQTDRTIRVFYDKTTVYEQEGMDRSEIEKAYAELDQKMQQMHFADMRYSDWEFANGLLFLTTDGEVYAVDGFPCSLYKVADGAAMITSCGILFQDGRVAHVTSANKQADGLTFLDGVQWPDVVDFAILGDLHAIGLRPDGSIVCFTPDKSNDMVRFQNIDIRAKAICSEEFIVRSADDRLVNLLSFSDSDIVQPEDSPACSPDAAAVLYAPGAGYCELHPDGSLLPIETNPQVSASADWQSMWGDALPVHTKIPTL